MKRTLERLMVILVLGLGVSMAWAPGARAAGNVQVSVNAAGDLIIRGDDLDNNIFLSDSSGVCSVAGRANTTINGSARDCFSADFSRNVDIQMGGGNDFVRLEAPPDPGPNPNPLNNPAGIRNALIIDTGTGDDTLELLQVSVANETRITTGGGNDVVFIDGAFHDRQGTAFDIFIRSDFRRGVTLNTGGNNDFLEIQNTVFRTGVAVTLGSGNDGLCSNSAEYRNQTPGQVRFDGGGGVEFFAIFGPEALSFPPDGALINFEGEDDDCSFNGGRS